MRKYVHDKAFRSLIVTVVAYAVVALVLTLAKYNVALPDMFIYVLSVTAYCAAIVALVFIARIVVLYIWEFVWFLSSCKIGRRVGVMHYDYLLKCRIMHGVEIPRGCDYYNVVYYRVPFCKPFVSEILENEDKESLDEDK